MVTAKSARSAFSRRVEKLNDTIEAALLRGELRTPEEIEAALKAVANWISVEGCKFEETLTFDFLELERLIQYDGWVQKAIPISEALRLPAEPEWDYEEIFAVIALMYAKCSRALLASKGETGMALAALAHADAIENFDRWKAVRGQARCRNPWDLMAKLKDDVDRITAIPFIEEARPGIIEQARSDGGKRAALARRATDPSQAVKREVYDEWQRRRAIGRVNASAFALEMHQKHNGKLSIGRIKNLQTQWNKEYHPAR